MKKDLIDLTREEVWALPMEVVLKLIPPHLQNPPTTSPELAYWYMASQTGPGGHVPCPAGSNCTTCPETYRVIHAGNDVPVTEFDDPDLQAETRLLIRGWYRAGGASVAPDDDIFLPFEPELVP